uniref:Lysine-specific demethylase 7A-like n=1 Tax=Saccoglossus kowalevskii TaxID=10224 RepID=A0ABM0N153_SACKO|nr:PREDICTED: lysine-specific demethylase 7A-like [Saccoglossus kowalevskii]
MASVPVYCICRQVYDVTRFMIECDICKDWFHGSCVGVSEHQSKDVEEYHCPLCARIHGPPKMKPRRNWHRHDYSEIDAGNKPVQTGTPVFMKELQSRTFPSAEEIIIHLHGSELTTDYFDKYGFNKPILINSKEGLGLVVTPPNFSVNDVDACVGKKQTFLSFLGWIHAVFTPVDTMVFGGNFLHHYDIGLQIQIHELEKRVKTPERFQFPWFETTMWYAAKHFQELFKDYRDDEKKPPAYLLKGVKSLCTALRSWTMKKEYLKQRQHEIPETINYSSLIKELSKELKQFDVMYPTLDDDEGPLFKSRSKKPRRDPADAPWNPKAKLVASCPKPDRPVREAAKKPNVESGLAEAAARLANQPRPKRQYIRKKSVEKPCSDPILEPSPSTSGLNLSHSMGTDAFQHELDSELNLSSSAPGSLIKGALKDQSGKSRKPKKGMATAKQRLSKILKLQKGGRLIL